KGFCARAIDPQGQLVAHRIWEEDHLGDARQLFDARDHIDLGGQGYAPGVYRAAEPDREGVYAGTGLQGDIVDQVHHRIGADRAAGAVGDGFIEPLFVAVHRTGGATEPAGVGHTVQAFAVHELPGDRVEGLV